MLRIDAKIRSEGEYANGADRQFIAVRKTAATGLPFVENQRVSVTIQIGNDTYAPGVLTTPAQKICMLQRIKDAEGNPVRLVDVPRRNGFERNQPVVLEVEGSNIQVLPSTE